jgi:iron(III) transport system ATP-binding protein
MFITVENISRQFAQRAGQTERTGDPPHPALAQVSIGIEQGRMLALVGPSGSGKTTLLRCIAGLERPDQGLIRIGGDTVFSATEGIDVAPEKRRLGLIFQSYALWPHLNVERNVAYPLRRRGLKEHECRARVMHYLDLVGCAPYARRYPHELSGGQQQRIALARALVYEPAVVLFDEPLSNLDAQLREHLRAQIRALQRSVGFTGVYVTHDQAEAFHVADRVAILSEGRILQSGTPEAICWQPASIEIAAFVGASNRCAGRLSADGAHFESADLGAVVIGRPPQLAAGTREVLLMVRPDGVDLHATPSGTATIIDRIPSGGLDEYTVRLASGVLWRIRTDSRTVRLDEGERVRLLPRADALFVFPSSPGPTQS